MKSKLPVLFILSWVMVISAAILYIWSDNTPNGELGRNLETVSIILLSVGAATLVYDVVTNWQRKGWHSSISYALSWERFFGRGLPSCSSDIPRPSLRSGTIKAFGIPHSATTPLLRYSITKWMVFIYFRVHPSYRFVFLSLPNFPNGKYSINQSSTFCFGTWWLV